MNLTSQTKLTKTEWINIEKSVSADELVVLNLISEGYSNVHFKYNIKQSFLQILRVDSFVHPNKRSEFDVFFYHEYLSDVISHFAKLYETIHSSTVSSSSLLKTLKITGNKKENKIKTTIIKPEPVNFIQTWINEKAPPKHKASKVKKADLIRIQQIPKYEMDSSKFNDTNIQPFEYILLRTVEQWIIGSKNKQNNISLYTMIQYKKLSILYINSHLLQFIDCIIEQGTQNTTLSDVLHFAPVFIEKNPDLLKYQDISLFPHQKELFSLFDTKKKNNRKQPKLVLYMAPTGTGKTLSPIGLSTEYRIIFVCVARHVGLALAKSCVSLGKKIAFAFGCDTASDIRLHYFAAINYTIHKKSGGIGKVDNSYGNNVEIMICDVKSYLTAMHYMLAFNPEENIITYWDEPTITMDYKEHPLHELIQTNWKENQISKVVLSSATLPKQHEIRSTLADFEMRFKDAEIYNITSYDCKKSISILNNQNKPVLPHFIFSTWDKLKTSIEHCENNKSILRYFDLTETVRCIEEIIPLVNDRFKPDIYFESISNITMDTVKLYYLFLLKKIEPLQWNDLFQRFQMEWKDRFETTNTNSNLQKTKSLEIVQEPVFIKRLHSVSSTTSEQIKQEIKHPFILPKPSVLCSSNIQNTITPTKSKGVLLTTSDAHTLTDGPTIYLAEDVDKIATFYIQQTKIPTAVSGDLMKRIEDNEKIQDRITILEKTLEDLLGKDAEKEKKMEKMNDDMVVQKKELRQIMTELEMFKNQIKTVNMDSRYIPNTIQHQTIWLPPVASNPNQEPNYVKNAYIPYIEESIVKRIMTINVSNQMKLLLLLGIGIFRDVSVASDFETEQNHANDKNKHNFDYIEIMKQLAMEQRLYMIIAQTDYIYGTNYQFCHAFIGKDLTHQMTPQKIIQAMGRVGRGKMQQDYTVRFRDNDLIESIFLPIDMEKNCESYNMNRLFSS